MLYAMTNMKKHTGFLLRLCVGLIVLAVCSCNTENCDDRNLSFDPDPELYAFAFEGVPDTLIYIDTLTQQQYLFVTEGVKQFQTKDNCSCGYEEGCDISKIYSLTYQDIVNVKNRIEISIIPSENLLSMRIDLFLLVDTVTSIFGPRWDTNEDTIITLNQYYPTTLIYNGFGQLIGFKRDSIHKELNFNSDNRCIKIQFEKGKCFTVISGTECVSSGFYLQLQN
jgi:hypothetical protein